MKLVFQLIVALLLYPAFSKGQVHNYGNLRMHLESDLGIFGDFSNDGNFTNNMGTLHVLGSGPQTFNGTNTIHTTHFAINKSNNTLKLDNVLQIAGVLTFRNGSIHTDHVDIDTEFVEFLDGASYTGESDRSFIDGVVRKTGNDAFVFPTGDNSILRTIGITAPDSVTDHFTAYYDGENPDGLYSGSSIAGGLDHISACEYWILNRTGGSSNVVLTLSWGSNSCGANDLCDLRVSRWDGAQWVSSGNGGVTGTVESGTMVSGTGCSIPDAITTFSPFTLGSSTSNNPLPIRLISFDAEVCESSVCLEWQTASEINNDFFTVEKSKDGKIWKRLLDIPGAGYSETILKYNTIDTSPFSGLSYYRLKQTDFNGLFEYASIEDVYLNSFNDESLNIYPNPSRDNITIKMLSTELGGVRIYNAMGQEVTSFVITIQNIESSLQLDISLLTPGIYRVKTNNNSGSFIKQ